MSSAGLSRPETLTVKVLQPLFGIMRTGIVAAAKILHYGNNIKSARNDIT